MVKFLNVNKKLILFTMLGYILTLLCMINVINITYIPPKRGDCLQIKQIEYNSYAKIFGITEILSPSKYLLSKSLEKIKI